MCRLQAGQRSLPDWPGLLPPANCYGRKHFLVEEGPIDSTSVGATAARERTKGSDRSGTQVEYTRAILKDFRGRSQRCNETHDSLFVKRAHSNQFFVGLHHYILLVFRAAWVDGGAQVVLVSMF